MMEHYCSYKKEDVIWFYILIGKNAQHILLIEKVTNWGPWVVQSVQGLTLGFVPGHDLMLHGIEPHIRLHTDGAKPTWDCLSPLSLFLSLSLSLSLKIHKHFNKFLIEKQYI